MEVSPRLLSVHQSQQPAAPAAPNELTPPRVAKASSLGLPDRLIPAHLPEAMPKSETKPDRRAVRASSSSSLGLSDRILRPSGMITGSVSTVLQPEASNAISGLLASPVLLQPIANDGVFGASAPPTPPRPTATSNTVSKTPMSEADFSSNAATYESEADWGTTGKPDGLPNKILGKVRPIFQAVGTARQSLTSSVKPLISVLAPLASSVTPMFRVCGKGRKTRQQTPGQ